MGCLLQVVFDASADTATKRDSIVSKHKGLFGLNNEPLCEDEENDRHTANYFVPLGVNQASKYIVERVKRDRNIHKVRIIS